MPSGSYANLLVLGSVAMDFVFELDSYPDEGDQVEGQVRIRPGGKGLFQSIACQRLQADTTLITSAGDDSFEQLIEDVVKTREHVNFCVEKKSVARAHDSRFATDIVGSIATTDNKVTYIACRDRARLTTQFLQNESKGVISESNAVLMTLDVSTDTIKALLELALAQEKSIPIIINASPPISAPIALINDTSCMIATKDEACQWLEKSGRAKATVAAMTAEDIGAAFLTAGAKKVILTLDDEGCVVIAPRAYREYDAFLSGGRRAPGADGDQPSGEQSVAPGGVRVRTGGTGARSAFCAAYAVGRAERHRDQLSDESEHELINFASAARYLAQLNGPLGWQAMPMRASVDEIIRNNPEVRIREEHKRSSK